MFSSLWLISMIMKKCSHLEKQWKKRTSLELTRLSSFLSRRLLPFIAGLIKSIYNPQIPSFFHHNLLKSLQLDWQQEENHPWQGQPHVIESNGHFSGMILLNSAFDTIDSSHFHDTLPSLDLQKAILSILSFLLLPLYSLLLSLSYSFPWPRHGIAWRLSLQMSPIFLILFIYLWAHLIHPIGFNFPPYAEVVKHMWPLPWVLHKYSLSDVW